VDEAVVDAVLSAGWRLALLAAPDGTAELTAAQYRMLAALASRGPGRMADPAAALGVTPSTADRMCGRPARKGLIRRRRAGDDRRAVLVWLTPAGRQAVSDSTVRRRDLAADILGRLPAAGQQATAAAAARTLRP
jgi:DNA-binding MarR family transcriptional regulator